MNILLSLALYTSAAIAQQYQGNSISGTLPTVEGAEVAFFKIADPSGPNSDLTLVNYYSHGTDGNRILESNIQRVVIVITGLQRDCNNYENDVGTSQTSSLRMSLQLAPNDEARTYKLYDRKSLTCFGGSDFIYLV